MGKEQGVPGWGAAMIGMGTVMMGALWLAMGDKLGYKSRKAFRENVTEKGLTDPREIWDACSEYHEELRAELLEAKVKIEAGDEVIRVAEGLISTRKMMEDHEPPAPVKQAIVSHWWSELMKLLVPWGIVMPEEVDPKSSMYFRLAGFVDQHSREATLRGYVYKYKEAYESYKRAYEEIHKRTEEGKLFEELKQIKRRREAVADAAAARALDHADAEWGSKDAADEAFKETKETEDDSPAGLASWMEQAFEEEAQVHEENKWLRALLEAAGIDPDAKEDNDGA